METVLTLVETDDESEEGNISCILMLMDLLLPLLLLLFLAEMETGESSLFSIAAERLLLFGSGLSVFARPDAEVTKIFKPLQKMSSVEIGLLLLKLEKQRQDCCGETHLHHYHPEFQ